MATRASTKDAWVEHTTEALRRAGYRSSAPRMAVVETLGRHGCLQTSREIADGLRSEGRDVGVATVYRALELLDGLGLLHRLETGEGPARYEPAHPSGEHHHHLICNDCGRVSAFEDVALERAVEKMARRLTFRVEGHEVALRGTCAACLAEAGHAAAG
jgi:Fur family transcriptional regulator, ferric uptake regulator